MYQPYKYFVFLLPVILCLFMTIHPQRGRAETKKFVGSATCRGCHEKEHTSFTTYSKKAHTQKNVQKMLPKLSQKEQNDCYSCHTTGYGQPSGFKSYAETPELADVGCETCHGPGSLHAETGDTANILRKPTIENCVQCHNAQRIKNFNFSPLIYSGAH